MFRSQTNRLPKSLIIMLFGVLALAALGCPRSALAVHRASFGLAIDAGDYEYLSEYGEWLEVPQFGMVWHPYAVAEWEPFFHGHWSRTNDGWAWISYEPFGWLVYHYGYWYHRPDIGWFWLPGRKWSPARVEWYTYGDYCAWAPIPPPNCRWLDPWDYSDFNVWIVIDVNNFTDEYVGHHRIDRPFRGEKIRHGAWSRRAPGIRHIETITGRQIPSVRISRERVDLRPGTPPLEVPTKYSRPREIERKRMILPEQEVNRIKRHSPQVEREVLVPRERAPKREIQRGPERQSERKSEDRQKKTIKRR
jgi:hypothetical protein